MQPARTRTLLAALLLGVVGSLVACDDGEGAQPMTCTLEGRASLVIDVLDAGGDPVMLPPGSVTYTVDGGEPRTLEAEFETLDNPLIINASSGDFEVTVAPPGYEPAVVIAEVGLTDDGCHPETETRELVLEDLADDNADD